MNPFSTVGGWLKSGLGALAGVPGDIGTGLTDLGRATKNAAVGLEYILTHPVEDVINGGALLAALLTGNFTAANNATSRLQGFVKTQQIDPAIAPLRHELSWFEARMYYRLARLRRFILAGLEALRDYVDRRMRRERAERIRDFHRSEAYTRKRVRWALSLVQKEAASGYQTGQAQRQSVIVKLLDLAVTRDPVVKDLVGKLVTGVLDLASIEDPLARLALGFVLTHVVDRLGVDKPIGDLAQSLLAPLIGQPAPKNLHDVIMDLSNRVGALEGDWAQFMADGGPQVLQAGREWAGITSVLTDIGLLAFFGQAVADPAAWAGEIADTLATPVTGTLDGMASLIREGL